MAETTVVPEKKVVYTPRTAAADFTKSLPQLGVDETATEAASAAKAVEDSPKTETVETVKTGAATEKKVEAQTEVKTAPVEDKIPRTAKDWEAYRAKNKERQVAIETERDNLAKRIAELEKAQPASATTEDPRIAVLSKEREELSERLRLVEITQHPQFKAYYDGKINTQVEMAKKIVGPDNAEAIASLLKLPDNEYRQQRLDELVTTLSPIAQSRIGGVLNQLQEIEMDREGQIQKAKTDYAAMQEKTKKDQETARTTNLQKAESMFTTALSVVQNPKDKDGLFVFQKRDGDEEWNKGVDETVKTAKDLLFGTQPPEQLMKAALHAAALPVMAKRYQEAQDKIKALEDQVAGLTAAQPRTTAGGGTEGGEGGAGSKQEKKTNFLDGRGQAAGWVKELVSAQQE